MQALWGKILAGEANSPGTYSKRTLQLLADMDKREAELFRSLCSFVWDIGGLVPLIYDVQLPLYNTAGINFSSLQHLELIGLINFDNLAGFQRVGVAQQGGVNYYGQHYQPRFPQSENNSFDWAKHF